MDTLSSYSDLPAEARLPATASGPGAVSPAAAAVAAARAAAAAAAANSAHGDNASANLNMLLDSGHGTESTLARGGGGGVGGVGAYEHGGAALGGGGRPGGVGNRRSDQRVILCIDDDEVNQMVLQGMLTSQNYKYLRVSAVGTLRAQRWCGWGRSLTGRASEAVLAQRGIHTCRSFGVNCELRRLDAGYVPSCSLLWQPHASS